MDHLAPKADRPVHPAREMPATTSRGVRGPMAMSNPTDAEFKATAASDRW